MKKTKKKMPKILSFFDIKYWFFDFIKISGWIPTYLFLRLKRYYISGKKPHDIYKGEYIIACNHITFIDPVIMMNTFYSRRVSFVATDELTKQHKFLGFIMKHARTISINKKNIAMKSIKEMQEVIRRRHLIGLFPEGHITTDNNLQDFKSGAIMLAILCNVPILPMYIAKRKSIWHRQRVMLGEKIDVKALINSSIPTMEDIERVSKIVREKEYELEKKLEELTPKKKR